MSRRRSPMLRFIHVTKRAHLPQIRLDGLQPRALSGERSLEHETRIASRDDLVYGATSLAAAARYLERLIGYHCLQPTELAVLVAGRLRGLLVADEDHFESKLCVDCAGNAT